MTLFARSFAFASVFTLAALGGCGGVSKDSQIAASIQVILANVIEGYATSTNGTVTASCGDGSTGNGTLSFSLPSGLTDPATLGAYLQAHPNTAELPLTFSNCVIKTCGTTLTLNGSGAVVLGIDDLLAAATTSTTQIPAGFTVKGTAVTATGLLEGSLTFAYKIKAIATSGSIKSVSVADPATPAPLEANGRVFNADEIQALANGC